MYSEPKAPFTICAAASSAAIALAGSASPEGVSNGRVGSLFGGGAILLPHLGTVLTVIRYVLLIPAWVFTFAYQKGADSRRITNIDRALAQMRTWAIVGLVVAAGMIVMIWLV